MRGHLVQRYAGSWSIVLDLGYQTNPATGLRKRKQRWITFRGTKQEADAKLADLVGDVRRGVLVEPTKLTFGAWLDTWLEMAIKPPAKTLRAYETDKSVIVTHLKPKLGAIALQQLRAADLKRYYTEAADGPAEPTSRERKGLAPSTLEQHHTIAHSALQAALQEGYVQRNVAKLVVGKPHAQDDRQDVLVHCWEAHEAKAFLTVARAAGPQPAAFYRLALDSGMRKGELGALRWADVDLAAGRVKIERQLVKTGPTPVFGPVKNKTSRTIEISAETVALLQRHRSHQAEVKLRNGAAYADHGLLFAKEGGDRRRRIDTLGDPLQVNNIGDREFRKLTKAAGVRRIKFHGSRHTCATLLLQAGVPANVVQHRLGHKKIEITLGIYAHALPSMQQDAAKRLAAILH